MRWPSSPGLLPRGPSAPGLSQQFLLHIFHRTLQPEQENIVCKCRSQPARAQRLKQDDSGCSCCLRGSACRETAREECGDQWKRPLGRGTVAKPKSQHNLVLGPLPFHGYVRLTPKCPAMEEYQPSTRCSLYFQIWDLRALATLSLSHVQRL